MSRVCSALQPGKRIGSWNNKPLPIGSLGLFAIFTFLAYVARHKNGSASGAGPDGLTLQSN